MNFYLLQKVVSTARKLCLAFITASKSEKKKEFFRLSFFQNAQKKPALTSPFLCMDDSFVSLFVLVVGELQLG